jgi:hypothetical protein
MQLSRSHKQREILKTLSRRIICPVSGKWSGERQKENQGGELEAEAPSGSEVSQKEQLLPSWALHSWLGEG